MPTPETTSPAADSSTATPSTPDPFAEYERTRLTESDPEHTESPSPPADSTPAQPAEQAPSTEGHETAASKPASPSDPSSSQQTPESDAAYKAKTARRIEELLEDRRALRARLDALESSAKPDATPASSPTRTLAQTVQSPDTSQPLLTDSAFYERFPDATVADFTRYVARYETASARDQEQQAQAVQQRFSAYESQVKAEEAKTPDFRTTLHPRVAQLVPVDIARAHGLPITGEHVLAQAIVESESAVSLLKHFTAHPEAIDQIAGLPSEGAILRAVGRLEATTTTTEPAVPATPEPSKAPAPSTTLGSKAKTSSLSEAEQALADGDYLRYQAIRTREEEAALTR